MAEIEIRGDGEVRIGDQAVGRVAWTMPFANTEMAGFWEMEGPRSSAIIEDLSDRIETLEFDARKIEGWAEKIAKIQKDAGCEKEETYLLIRQIITTLEGMDFETWA